MSLTNYCPSPPPPPPSPRHPLEQTGNLVPPLARGQELMAGFKLNFTYLEGHQRQLRTHCNFSTHHHSPPPWKTNIFPSWHSLPKKRKCQEKEWQLDEPKETKRNTMKTILSHCHWVSQDPFWSIWSLLNQPFLKSPRSVTIYPFGCGRSTRCCGCSAAPAKHMPITSCLGMNFKE